MSAPTPNLERQPGIVPVVAVLVARERPADYAGPTLKQAVQSIQEQTARPQLLVIADTSEDGHMSRTTVRELRAPGSEGHSNVAWPASDTDAASDTKLAVPVELAPVTSTDNFGQAIQAALDQTSNMPAATQWYWLLHDDMVAARPALQELMAVTTGSETIAVVGPKQVDYTDPDTLLSLGIDATGSARRVFKTEPGEIDQGQHDAREDVLAVGTAGALVRKTVWEEVGGLDRALGPFGDGLEFGRRVRMAGHRVVVAPKAVVEHEQASFGKDEDGTASFPRRRAEQIYNWLVGLPGWQLPLALVWLPILTVLRIIGRLVTGKPKLAVAEARAYGQALRMTISLRRARKNLKAVSLIPRGALDTLVSDPAGIRTRRRMARKISSDKGETEIVLDAAARSSLRRHTTQTITGLLALLALVGAVAWLAWAPYSSGIQGGLWGSLPANWGTLAAEAFSGWQLTGDGLAGAGSPLLAVFTVVAAPFALLGIPPTAVGFGLYFLAAPLAAWAGWTLAAALTRSPSVRVAVGALWVASPAFIVPLISGNIPAVVLYLAAVPTFIGLWRAIRPPLALHAGGATNILKTANPDRTSWIALGIVGAAVSAAASPLAAGLVLAYSLVLVFTYRAGWDASQVSPTQFPASKTARLTTVVLPAALSVSLLAPSGVQAFRAGGAPKLLAWFLGPYSPPAGVLGIFGFPSRPPIAETFGFQQALSNGQFPQIVILLMMVPAALVLMWAAVTLLVGWKRPHHSRLLALWFGALGLWAAGHGLAFVLPGSPTALLVGAALLMTAVIPAAYAGYKIPAYSHTTPRSVRTSRILRRGPAALAVAGGLGALVAAMIFGPTGTWVNQRVSAPAESLGNPLLETVEEDREADPLEGMTALLGDAGVLISPAAAPIAPVISQEAQVSPRAARLLVVYVDGNDIRAALFRGPGPLVADVYREASNPTSVDTEAGADAELSEALAHLVTGVAADVAQTFSEHAIDAVLVGAPPEATLHVQDTFDQAPGLERVGTVGEAAMWRVRPGEVAPSRVSVHGSSEVQIIPSGAVRVDTDYVSEGAATLVLAEVADPGWKATLDGEALEPTELSGSGSWRQAFDLPDASGRLIIEYSQPYLPVWWSALGLLFAVALVLAVPWRARPATLIPLPAEDNEEGATDAENGEPEGGEGSE